MSRRFAPRFTATVAAAALAASATAALAQTTLRMATWIPDTTMPGPAFVEWAKSIEAASNGALRVQIFPNGQLGRAPDHYDMARDGIADIAWAVPGFSAGRFPIFAVSELPFMISNSAEGIVAFDEWYRRHAAREMGEVHYCMALTAPVSTLNFNKQVNTPADIKGLRMRPQSATVGRYFGQLGAVAVTIPASESKQAFDRGLLDGMAFPWRTLIPFGLEKSVRFHMDMPITTAPSMIAMNKRRIEGLPAAQRKVVDEHCTPQWASRIIGAWQKWEDEGRAELAKLGNTIYQIPAEARAAWRDSTRQIYADWAKDAAAKGIDAAKELADLQGRLKARNAGF
jgi:TRAP-type transport system periplasmic protein